MNDFLLFIGFLALYHLLSLLWKKYFPPEDDNYPQIDGLP